MLGCHLNTSSDFMKIPQYMASKNIQVGQIFLRSPRTFNSLRKNKEDLLEFGKEVKKHNVNLFVHGNYLVNLCRPPTDKLHKLAVKLISEDMNDSLLINAKGVVIHMGSNVLNLPLETAKNNYVNGIKKILFMSHPDSILILETGCGEGKEVGTSLYDLGWFRSQLTEEEKPRVKFCLDTCHMYAAGYDLGCPEYIDLIESYIETTLQWENIVLIHLNDSKYMLKSKKDRHADIGKGCIELEGLVKFIKICSIRKIPLVLEVPGEEHYDKDNHKYTYGAIEQIKDIKLYLNQ